MAENSSSDKRILITGATGFIGRALADHLLAQSGYQLICCARSLCQLEQKYNPVLIKDINAETDWSEALDHIDCVVHAAGKAHVNAATDNAALTEFRKINTAGTINLARQAAAQGVKRFIFLSSIGVNGTVSEKPFLSTDAPNARDGYSISKLEAEIALQELAKTVSMEIVIIRPPLVYGPDAPGNFGRLAKLAQTGLPLPLGAIHNRKSFVGIDNLVDFIATSLTHPNAAGKTLLVSDDCDVSTTELLKVMAEASGKRSWLIPVPVAVLRILGKMLGQQGTIDRLCDSLSIDISESKNILGWKPLLSLTEGVRKCYLTVSTSDDAN